MNKYIMEKETSKMNKYEQVKIFIPTKGRLDDEKTYNVLKSLGLSPTLVIEPQEVEKAAALGYNFVTLPANNMGIAFSRNYILSKARKEDFDYVCVMDDDIYRFGYILDGGKRDYNNNAILTALDRFVDMKACGTMQSTQFAWCQIKPIVYNKCIQCVHFWYMPQLRNISLIFSDNIIEDKDFSLELILNYNIETFRFNHLFFSTNIIGSKKGGIENRLEQQKLWSYNMQQKWGKEIIDVITEKNCKDGMINIRINWRYVNKLIKEKRDGLQK